MNTPADLSPLLEAFFTQRLIAQRKVSPHTINSKERAERSVALR
jgi:hypothetical protein